MNSFVYIEDDPHSREVMTILLRQVMGFEQVTVWEHGQNLIERLASLPYQPSTFLLDIHMLPVSGYEIHDTLRAHADYANACIIAVTASVMTSDIHKLREYGFNSLIAKPVKMQQFPLLLRQILNGQAVWVV
jgi:CheY-like chemotaxis protein